MSDIGTEAFDAIYEELPEVRATATFGRTDVARCLCAGVGQTRNPTEIGAGIEYDVSLRIVATDEPAKEAALGLTVKVTAHGETNPTTYRIVGRRAVGGIINFSLEYQHGQ
jgi:hypothetical protein